MNICSPISPDWHMAGQTVIVLDDPAMLRRGYAGREGQIDRLYGEDMPGMAMVALAATVRGEAPDYIVLPLACLSPVRRTPHPDLADWLADDSFRLIGAGPHSVFPAESHHEEGAPMTTIVTHSCGHQQSHALFGMFAADTERQARQLARRKCTACFQGAKAAQGDADAALLNGITPATLSGSDKQASWAGTIRAKRIAALIRSGADDTVIHALAALTEAKWWIDHRGASDAELIATATAPAS